MEKTTSTLENGEGVVLKNPSTIEDLVFEITAREEGQTAKRRLIYFDGKVREEIRRETLNNDRYRGMTRKETFVLEMTGAICAMASPLFGGPAVKIGAALSGSGQIFNAMAGQTGRNRQAGVEGINHCYQLSNTTLHRWQQEQEEAKRSLEKIAAMRDSILRNMASQTQSLAR